MIEAFIVLLLNNPMVLYTFGVVFGTLFGIALAIAVWMAYHRWWCDCHYHSIEEENRENGR